MKWTPWTSNCTISISILFLAVILFLLYLARSFFWNIVIALNSHFLSKDLLSVVLMAAEELVGSLVP